MVMQNSNYRPITKTDSDDDADHGTSEDRADSGGNTGGSKPEQIPLKNMSSSSGSNEISGTPSVI